MALGQRVWMTDTRAHTNTHAQTRVQKSTSARMRAHGPTHTHTDTCRRAHLHARGRARARGIGGAQALVPRLPYARASGAGAVQGAPTGELLGRGIGAFPGAQEAAARSRIA